MLKNLLAFPARLMQRPTGDFEVSFIDLPDAVIRARTEAEALEHASSVLTVKLNAFRQAGRNPPHPSWGVPNVHYVLPKDD